MRCSRDDRRARRVPGRPCGGCGAGRGADRRCRRRSRRRWRPRRRGTTFRAESVPRHHGLPGHRPRRRRVRRLRPAARHPRDGASDQDRCRGRHQHVVLAFGDVQQRRHQGALQRRVGWRHPAPLPRDRQAGVGRQCALHHREQQAGLQELLQDAGAADLLRELRGAQRIAAFRSRGARSWSRAGIKEACRSSTGPTSRSRRRSPTSTADRSTARA